MRQEYAAAHERHSVGARYRSEAEGTAKTRDKEKGVACAPNSLFLDRFRPLPEAVAERV